MFQSHRVVVSTLLFMCLSGVLGQLEKEADALQHKPTESDAHLPISFSRGLLADTETVNDASQCPFSKLTTGKYFARRFTGRRIRKTKATSFRGCWKKCRRDERCWTFAFNKATRVCNLHRPRYCSGPSGEGAGVKFSKNWVSGAKRCEVCKDFECQCPL